MVSSHQQLSRRERQIMDVLYERGEASVADVKSGLEDSPSYSTVRALLRNLTDKGHVTFRQDGARYLYQPTVEKSVAAQSAIARLVSTFFAGDKANAVLNLLGGEELTDDELKVIERTAARLRKRDKK